MDIFWPIMLILLIVKKPNWQKSTKVVLCSVIGGFFALYLLIFGIAVASPAPEVPQADQTSQSQLEAMLPLSESSETVSAVVSEADSSDPAPKIEKISFPNPEARVLIKGEMVIIEFEVASAECTLEDLRITCKDETLFEIKDHSYTAGKGTFSVTAKELGAATVTVRSAEDPAVYATLQLVCHKTGKITLSGAENLMAGENYQMMVSVSPAGLTAEDISIACSNEDLLTVSDITFTDKSDKTEIAFTAAALSAGDAVITVIASDGKNSVEKTVHITEPEPVEEPAEEEPVIEEPEEENPVVYVYVASSGNGIRYHRKAQCGNMKNSYQIPLEEAQTYLSPCGNCY